MNPDRFLVAAAIVVSAATARAEVSLRSEISARQVEVGDSFQVQLTIMSSSDDDSPQNPRLAPIDGLTLRGPSISSQMSANIVNGHVSRTSGMTATWILTATRPGKFEIGPPTVELAGARRAGRALEVEVLPQGSLQGRSPSGQPRGIDPFDVFDPFGRGSPLRGRPFPQGFFDDNQGNEPELPETPEELKVDRAPDKTAFVRVIVKPERPVVGQQITVDVYGYAQRVFKPTGLNEPSRSDFLTFQIEDPEGESQVPLKIGEDTWVAERLAQYAMFPLKSGKLRIGSVSATLTSFGWRKQLERQSAPVDVTVDEPPLAKRPPGYRLGDVGQYQLSATVEPRKITEGDAVSVVAQLQGVGNVPSDLPVPQQKGVEWLEPTVRGSVEPKASSVKGERSFTYVVKLHESGNISLGEFKLPYWDPKAKAYRTARAELGSIEVTPSADTGKPKPPAPPKTPLASVGAPRHALAIGNAGSRVLSDAPWFLWLLFGAPLGVVILDGGVRLTSSMRRRWAAGKSEPKTLALQALQAAKREAKDNATQCEKALLLAIESSTGIKARALLKHELEGSLAERAVPPDLIQECLALLEACETARFTPSDAEQDRDLVARTERATRELLRRRRS